MRRPDVRQLVIEQVLELAAEAGVDDVVLIARWPCTGGMTEAELRHALGDRIYDAFAPHGLLQQHDAEDPDNLIHLGLTDQGEDVEINKRAATSDLLVYVNINLVAMDGGHKSVATGPGQLQEPAPPPQRPHHAAEPVLHGPAPLRAALLELAHGPADRRQSGVKVFQIETTLNTDTFPEQFRFLQRREWEWSAQATGPPSWPRQGRSGPHPRPRGPVDLPLGARRPTG